VKRRVSWRLAKARIGAVVPKGGKKGLNQFSQLEFLLRIIFQFMAFCITKEVDRNGAGKEEYS
jgi:hypothetical protein